VAASPGIAPDSEVRGLADGAPVAGGALMTPADLAELLGAFNEVTGRLEQTHGQLRAEVARLNAELRNANEALERSRRLAAIGEMAAGIAHEVRNPVGSIQLYARMLEEDLAELPEARRTAVKISNAARGLNAIVGDVLAFSREIKPRAGMVEASGLLQSSVEACADLIDRLGERLRVVWSGQEGVEVACDAELMARALVNVVRNACEAMGECVAGREGIGGHAGQGAGGDDAMTHELLLEWNESQDEDGGVWTVLGVGDTGPGLSDEVIERMFNPFFTTRAAGTGLGLSIVHRIVEAHGGRVRVGRRTPRGARVEIWLPRDAATRGSRRETASCMETAG
jgi:signal transduction histidine kinase